MEETMKKLFKMLAKVAVVAYIAKNPKGIRILAALWVLKKLS